MQKVILYSLLCALWLPMVSPWGTIVYYHTHKDYIARVLCENRDKPAMHCDGKCYLARRLKSQQDKQDKETAERVRNSPTLELFCLGYEPFRFTSHSWVLVSAAFPEYTFPPHRALVSDLFRPPQS